MMTKHLFLCELCLLLFELLVLSCMETVGLSWHFNINLECDYLQHSRVFIENLDVLHTILSYYEGEQNIYCML